MTQRTATEFCPSCGVGRESTKDQYCRKCGSAWAGATPATPNKAVVSGPTPIASKSNVWMWATLVAVGLFIGIAIVAVRRYNSGPESYLDCYNRIEQQQLKVDRAAADGKAPWVNLHDAHPCS